MTASLRFTRRADNDLTKIFDWLGQAGSGAHARHRFAWLMQPLTDLVEYPERGRIVAPPDRRSAVSGDYRIVYAVSTARAGQTVLIIRILGPGQNS